MATASVRNTPGISPVISRALRRSREVRHAPSATRSEMQRTTAETGERKRTPPTQAMPTPSTSRAAQADSLRRAGRPSWGSAASASEASLQSLLPRSSAIRRLLPSDSSLRAPRRSHDRSALEARVLAPLPPLATSTRDAAKLQAAAASTTTTSIDPPRSRRESRHSPLVPGTPARERGSSASPQCRTRRTRLGQRPSHPLTTKPRES